LPLLACSEFFDSLRSTTRKIERSNRATLGRAHVRLLQQLKILGPYLWLLLLIIVGWYWLQETIGISVTKSAFMVIAVAVVPSVIKAIELGFDKTRVHALTAAVVSVVKFAFEPLVLLVFTIVLGVAVILVTSVQVTPTKDFDGHIELVAGQTIEVKRASGDAVVRFLVFFPVRRPVQIEATGYETVQKTVWPGLPTRVTLGSVDPAPTILLRIPPIHHMHLNGGRLEIQTPEPLTIMTTSGKAASLLGPRRELPAAWEANWKEELQELPNSAKERSIAAWRQPVHRELRVNKHLTATFFTRANTPVACVKYELNNQTMQDVPLQAYPCK
jgi:hypothetical protein